MMRISGVFFKEKTKNNEIDNEQKIKPPLIVKRKNDRINEVITEIQPVIEHIPNSYGDRFIPRRYTLDRNLHQQYNYNVTKPSCNMTIKYNLDDFINARCFDGYWRKHSFKIMLDNVIKNENTRLFRFSDSTLQSRSHKMYKILPMTKCVDEINKNLEKFDWPCKPRSKPMALEDSTHDLPRSFLDDEKNIIQWSAKGQMATVSWNKFVLWDPNDDVTRVYLINYIKTLSFSPTGDYLVTVRNQVHQEVLQIWDVRNPNKICLYNSYPLHKDNQKICLIEWYKDGKNFLCGFEKGDIKVFDAFDFYEITTLQCHPCEINFMRFSPNMKYLATSDDEGGICIFQCTTINFSFYIKFKLSKSLPFYIEWHPWDDDNLIIVESFPAIINVYDVKSGKVVACYERRDDKLQFNSMTINKLTGELFIGCTIKNPDNEISYEVIVLSSLDNVVEVLKNHTSTIKYMLWSPNNLQLATVSEDNLIIIWNIFSINDKRWLNKSIHSHSLWKDKEKKTNGYSIWERLKSIR